MIEFQIIYKCGVCGARNDFEPSDEFITFDLTGSEGGRSCYVYDNCEKCGVQNEIKLYAPNKAVGVTEV